MSTGELEGFHFRFEQGSSEQTLLLLHGTGADENDLIPLGRSLSPHANLISPRGQVLENGMPRFFRRFAEGVLDVEDLKARTDSLVSFVRAATGKFDLDVNQLTAVGFSNGANIAASVLLRHPTFLRAAILLRPMVPYEPETDVDLSGAAVFVGAGRADPMVEASATERLVQILRDAGAEVELSWSPGGHSLEQEEVAKAQAWLANRQPH